MANTSANWNAVSHQMSHFCRQWRLKPSASKTISSVFHQENALFLIDPLIHLFNTSICTIKVPDKLKLAKVIPVYKKGETHLPGNYRPISLLSIFDKLLENYVL